MAQSGIKLFAYMFMIKNRFGIDRAVIYGSLNRIFAMLAGLVNMILVGSKFSRELQGYYYTFLSLSALSIFLELGFGTVIQQFTSHEWAKLSIGDAGCISGDENAKSRLSSLARVSFRWYRVACILAILGISIGGYIFLSQRPSTGINWQYPWFLLCIFTGINILFVPFWAILDGCNQIMETNRARFILVVFSNLAAWIAMLSNAALWSVPILSGISITIALVFFITRYRRFILDLLTPRQGPIIDWRNDVWPMQWRIAVSCISGYFIFYLFTPVLFYFHGPIVAGQMGMTWSIVSAISTFASIWIITRIPTFGIMIARKDYLNLDRIYRTVLKQTMAVGVLIAAGSFSVITLLNLVNHPFAERFLPLAPTGLFTVATIINLYINSMAYYLRAHRQEPYLVISVAGGILNSLSTVLLGSKFSALGCSAGYLICSIATLIPAIRIYTRCIHIWHGNPTSLGGES